MHAGLHSTAASAVFTFFQFCFLAVSFFSSLPFSPCPAGRKKLVLLLGFSRDKRQSICPDNSHRTAPGLLSQSHSSPSQGRGKRGQQMVEERWGQHLGRQPLPAATVPPHGWECFEICQGSVMVWTLGGDRFSPILTGAWEGTSPAGTFMMAHRAGQRWGKLLGVLPPPDLPWDGKNVSGRKNSPSSPEGNFGNCPLARHPCVSQHGAPAPWVCAVGPQLRRVMPRHITPQHESGGVGGEARGAHIHHCGVSF